MMHHLLNSCIGVWGYGAVGKSFIRFLRTQGYVATIHLFDDHGIASDIVTILEHDNVRVHTQQEQFLAAVETLLPSPGVAVPRSVRERLLIGNEYNLFRSLWPGKIVAITGTIGKTTVTSLIAHLLKAAGISVRMGGNIGIPLLDLLPGATDDMMAVIELSSFQLEYGIDQGPDVAVITNCYPNHLDRHGNFDAYVHAKMNLIAAQSDGQQALLPYSLKPYLPPLSQGVNCAWMWFGATIDELDPLSYNLIFWRRENVVMKSNGMISVCCGDAPATKSFIENWLIAYAVLDVMRVPIIATGDITIPDHRLAHIMTVQGIAFFNDSKATVPQATLAAVQKLIHEYQRAPVLFLGGLSKGVDRKPLIYALAQQVRHLVVFGREAEQLATWAREAGITVHSDETLEGAFYTYVKTAACEHDVVLFSPSGSSYDLFHDFQDRGNCFVQLVHAFATVDGIPSVN